jgi:hypothetical protein
MKALCRFGMVGMLALLLVVPAALAEDRVPFRQEELDQMLAPIALYPDPLLSQVLMASTYPLEVVQAARWSRANPALKGQDAVNAAQSMDWEPSVQSLTAFPEVLAMMSERLEWTERLGEAFLAQQGDVMNTVQGLRQRAEATGHLRSSEQMRVEHQNGAILIEPPAPGIVYVPYYDPASVYGSWWWPAYPPVAWAPPAAYYVVPAYPSAWLWGSGIVLSTGFFFGHFDWPHHHVRVRHFHHSHQHGHPVHVHSTWRHDPVHRRGIPFRSVEARQRFEQLRSGNRSSSVRAIEARPQHWERSRRDGDGRDTTSAARPASGGSAMGSGASPARSSPPPARATNRDRRSEAPAPPAITETRRVQSGAPVQAQPQSPPGHFDRPPSRTGERESSRQPSRQAERRAGAPPIAPRAAVHAPAVRSAPRPQVIQGGAGHAARGMPPQQAAPVRAPAPRAMERAAPHAAPAVSRAPSVQRPHPRSQGAARGNERSAERGPGRRS